MKDASFVRIMLSTIWQVSEGDEKFTVVRRYAFDDRSSDEEKAETQPKLKKAKGKK